MVQQSRVWQVVGGVGKGGLLVRAGKDLASEEFPSRLSVGALVRELLVENDRLEYKLISGSGPEHGWVSTKVQDRPLLVLTDDSFEVSEKPKVLRERSTSQQNKMLAPPTMATAEFVHKQQMLYRRTDHPTAPSMMSDVESFENGNDSVRVRIVPNPGDTSVDSVNRISKETKETHRDAKPGDTSVDSVNRFSKEAKEGRATEPSDSIARTSSLTRHVASHQPRPREAHGIYVGAIVQMHDLVAAPRFNGQRATVEVWDEEVSRWQVHVALTGEIVKVKPTNLIVVPKEKKTPASTARTRSQSMKQAESIECVPHGSPVSAGRAPVFRKGALVSIQNLSSEAASGFNGCECTCEEWDADDGRWIVRVHRDGSLKKLKIENLKIETQLVVHIFGPGGLALNVDVSREWQVHHIKDQIERMTSDISQSQQRLFFDDAELEDDQLVADIFRQVDPRSTSLELTLVRKPVFKAVIRDPVIEPGLRVAEDMVFSKQPMAFNAFAHLPHQRARHAGKGNLKGSFGHIRSVTSGKMTASNGQLLLNSHGSRSGYSSAW